MSQTEVKSQGKVLAVWQIGRLCNGIEVRHPSYFQGMFSMILLGLRLGTPAGMTT